MDSITIPAHLAAVAAAYQALEEENRALRARVAELQAAAAAPVGGAGTDSVSRVPALAAKEAKAAAKAAEKEAIKAAKLAEKGAIKAAKLAEREAIKAAKGATKPPKTKGKVDILPEGHRILAINHELYMVDGKKVFEFDLMSNSIGPFVGTLSNDEETINRV